MRSLAPLALFAALLSTAPADDVTKRVEFKKGSDHAILTGKITGRDSVLYKLNAKDKQFLQVTVLPEGKSADFNIYIPGRGPGDEALYTSATGGMKYLGQLYKTGDHTISIFQNRAAARRGEVAEYKLMVRVTDKQPVDEEVPATGPVPQKVIDDCLAELRKQVGNETGMKVISSKRGENSFIIDVKVDSAEKPWRCYHDGTKCTGAEYQGEG
ncbi:hypothetical protein [Luteolibacter marinus]|uniref:hypothetical protein n=1 Tax=Luteolibacter marinus TaxID=2776705 RepID=UPI001868EA56|nr:hypothetical protein [Luteolibacter marinus]